jgi:hypothetical protein
MVTVAIGPEAKDWLDKNCNRSERDDVSQWMQDLGHTGLDPGDADRIKLVQGQTVGTAYTGLTVNCFIVPLRVSTAWRKGRTLWLGILETASGPSAFAGRLDLVAVFATDPTVMGLVSAEMDILAVARLMYP